MLETKPKTILRLLLIAIVFLAMYILLLFHLWKEQVAFGERHRKKIASQSVREIRIPGARGRILSSDGKPLADIAPSNNVIFHPSEMRQAGKRSNTIKHIMECAEKICRATGRKNTLNETDITKHLNQRPALPIEVINALDIEELILLKEMIPQIKGMQITTEPVRTYPFGAVGSHIVGYLGLEDPKSAEDRDEYFYYNADYKGQTGLEKAYDSPFSPAGIEIRGLRGTPGRSRCIVDHMGYVHEQIFILEKPKKGNDLVLTIESSAQSIASELMREHKGALILMDPFSGDILAMVSAPEFNPNIFLPKIALSEWVNLSKNPKKLLLNRALNGTYTPGSIIKPLVGLAMLENGMQCSATEECQGAAKVGNTIIKCWNWKYGGHGEIDFYDAIKKSCNVYFIQKGRELGFDKICKTFQAAGIGSKTGIELPEAKGIAPSREEKKKRFNEKWNEYDTALLAIGQGMILITPIQAIIYTAAIANGGKIIKPVLLKEVNNGSNVLFRKGKPEIKGTITDQAQLLDHIKKGMFEAVNNESGTARKAKNSKILLFGKTGTAEVGRGENKLKNTWFIGFGEKNGRAYAISIIVEEGISGGATSAPIASEFFEKWLE